MCSSTAAAPVANNTGVLCQLSQSLKYGGNGRQTEYIDLAVEQVVRGFYLTLSESWVGFIVARIGGCQGISQVISLARPVPHGRTA